MQRSHIVRPAAMFWGLVVFMPVGVTYPTAGASINFGAGNPAVDPKYSLEMFQALQKAGAHVGFTQYPEVGHFSWLHAYSDPVMMEWLFRQHK